MLLCQDQLSQSALSFQLLLPDATRAELLVHSAHVHACLLCHAVLTLAGLAATACPVTSPTVSNIFCRYIILASLSCNTSTRFRQCPRQEPGEVAGNSCVCIVRLLAGIRTAACQTTRHSQLAVLAWEKM